MAKYEPCSPRFKVLTFAVKNNVQRVNTSDTRSRIWVSKSELFTNLNTLIPMCKKFKLQVFNFASWILKCPIFWIRPRHITDSQMARIPLGVAEVSLLKTPEVAKLIRPHHQMPNVPLLDGSLWDPAGAVLVESHPWGEKISHLESWLWLKFFLIQCK